MRITLNFEMGTPPSGITKGHDELAKDGCGIGFRLWS
jgi:hypothetical protein